MNPHVSQKLFDELTAAEMAHRVALLAACVSQKSTTGLEVWMSKERELLERALLYVDVLCPIYEEIRAYLAEPKVKRISDPDSVDLQSRCRGDKL